MNYLTKEQIEREDNYECIDCGISIHDYNPKCNECLTRKAGERPTHSDYEEWWGLPEEV